MVIVDFQHALPVGHQLHTRGLPDFTRCRVMPAHSSSYSQPLAQNSSAAVGGLGAVAGTRHWWPRPLT